jgi:hypothetical protein
LVTVDKDGEDAMIDDNGYTPVFELTADNQWTGPKSRLTTESASSPSKSIKGSHVLKIVKMEKRAESKAKGAKQWVAMDTKEGVGKDMKAGVVRLRYPKKLEPKESKKKKVSRTAAKAAEGTNDASTWNLWIAAMTVTAIVLSMSYLVANVGGRATRN